jgi:acetolactate synthase I/II/III large subunit
MVTTEVGQHQMWAAQSFNLSQPRSFISSGGLGTMGFGFPAALGIQVAFPERVVVDIAGDGSFQMTLQELAVAMDYGLPVKVAIINNSNLGMIRQWQGKMYNRLSEADMASPDYVKLAEAYGGTGFVITHPDQVDTVIQEAYAIMDRPVLMDFRVHERQDVYPWVPAGASNEEMLTEGEATV